MREWKIILIPTLMTSRVDYTLISCLAVLVMAPAPIACVQPCATCFELLPVLLADTDLDIQAEFDRPFATEQGQVLMMDVFRPAEAEHPTPAVVLVHGGFWLFGERWYMHDWAADLAGQGYTAISIDYRLLENGGQYPTPVADVLAAVAHVREHAAELNIDPERVALFGVSAGAHLVLLAGMAPDASIFSHAWPAGESAYIRAIVEIYGPADFTVDWISGRPWQQMLMTAFLDAPKSEAPERWQEASPIFYVRADGPPVLIIHGLFDGIVPVTQAHALRDAMQAAGQPYRYIEVPDAGHWWGALWFSPWAQRHRPDILHFLGEHLYAN